jgi:hypothetical protein
MKTFLLQAPRDFVDAGIKKGFIIQVPSQTTGSSPNPSEVRDALRMAGFGPKADGWVSAGNWIVREIKI